MSPLLPWHCCRQEAGPTCLSAQDKLLVCSSNSTRTQRAGVYEILYWSRDDRTFCDSAFFRHRVTVTTIENSNRVVLMFYSTVTSPTVCGCLWQPEDATSEQCRARLLSRNQSCYKTCDRCNFQCNNALARTIATAWKCSAGLPVQGIMAAARISDVGVDIYHRHGAVRTTGKPSIPEVAWPETHDTLIGNNVDHPKVPRDCALPRYKPRFFLNRYDTTACVVFTAISCRKMHPESNYGHYVPPIDDRGIPRKREGFHVSCLFDSQCHSRCGEHPIHGAFDSGPVPTHSLQHVLSHTQCCRLKARPMFASRTPSSTPMPAWRTARPTTSRSQATTSLTSRTGTPPRNTSARAWCALRSPRRGAVWARTLPSPHSAPPLEWPPAQSPLLSPLWSAPQRPEAWTLQSVPLAPARRSL